VTALLSFAVADAARAEELEVVAHGKSNYVIAVAEDGVDKGKITQAADLLRSLIAEATGVELPVVRESEASAGKPAIYLGKSQAARRRGLQIDEIRGWGYLNCVAGRDIFLVGEDRAGWGQVGGFSGYAGTLKAVTAFLESQAGIRFVLPGRMGVQVPKLERLTVDAKMNVSWSPRFQFVIGRRVSPPNGQTEYSPYAIANNFSGRYANDTEVFKSYGSHSYPAVVPQEKYLQTHPEYFALLKIKDAGERNPMSKNHLCISNPKVHGILLEDLEQRFDEGYQMVMLGQSDGYRECKCGRCQSIHPDLGEKIWIVHRKLAEEMKRRRPDKQVVLMSYVSTTKPPMTFDRFPDNVVVLNNRYVPEYFRAWKRFDTPRIVFLPNWLGCWRRVAPRYAVNQVRLFVENNVIGIYLCGGLDTTDGAWGLNGPSYYAFGKAMEDPTRDADELEREYVAASFGEAAGPMGEFFSTMHRRLEVRELFDRRETGVPDRRYRGYPFEMLPGDYVCHFFAPAILNKMSASLDRALALAEDGKVRARLELVEAEFRYLRSVASVHHVYRAYCVAPSWDLLKAVERQVHAHRQTLDWLQPGGRAREPGGRRQLRTPYSTGWPVNRRIEMPDTPPFNWDFDELDQRRKLPNVEIEIRTRGGQALRPYAPDGRTVDSVRPRGRGKVPDGMAEDGFVDPAIKAPFDQ